HRGGPGEPARVRANGTELEAELVVAADGIHSPARGALFPGHPGPRYVGFTTWRLVVPELARPFTPHETWGRGVLWGTQPLPDGRTYAYATAAVSPGGSSPDGELAELLRRFGGWHEPVPALLAAAAPEDVLRSDAYRMARALPAYHRGRVALLGDAAHAMPPTLGQGGNQAVEDAVVLAHHVRNVRHAGSSATALPVALAAYSAERLPRTMEIVRRASRAARMNTLTSAPACALRDASFAALSGFGPQLALRALDGIADWSPPGHPYPAGAGGRSGRTETTPT
ncbi:FAD-dependent monooxygenase, partial [Streptomyces daliensis]|nr:FAD-dependent monooxygenase [Streptomyces daliensis]